MVRFHHSPSLLPLHPDIFISFLLIRISRSRSRRLSISILYHLPSTLSTSHPHVSIPYILSRIFYLPLFLLPLSIVSLYHIHAQPLVSSEQFTSPFVFRNWSLQCFPFVLPYAGGFTPSTSHNPLYAYSLTFPMSSTVHFIYPFSSFLYQSFIYPYFSFLYKSSASFVFVFARSLSSFLSLSLLPGPGWRPLSLCLSVSLSLSLLLPFLWVRFLVSPCVLIPPS